jgi:hypothetical protein
MPERLGRHYRPGAERIGATLVERAGSPVPTKPIGAGGEL